MNPTALTNFEWTEIGRMLTTLWVVVIFIVLFASNMLLGHNFIPSLVASQHIPDSFQKVRPVLYGLAIIFFGLAVFFMIQVINLAGVLDRIWADYWI